MLFSIVSTASLVQLIYSNDAFSPLYVLQLWIMTFVAWVTTSDFSQRCQKKNCTKSLYWSALFALCTYVTLEQQTPSTILEEGGEKTFVGDNVVTTSARRNNRIEQTRVVQCHRAALSSETPQYIAPSWNSSRRRIRTKPIPVIRIHAQCVFQRQFDMRPDHHKTLSRDLKQFEKLLKKKGLWDLDILDEPSALDDDIPEDETISQDTPAFLAWRFNFWTFVSFLCGAIGHLEHRGTAITARIGLLIPSGVYCFNTSGPGHKQKHLDICYCTKRHFTTTVAQKFIPIQTVLGIRKLVRLRKKFRKPGR